MPRTNDELRARLARYREINLEIVGRKSGKATSRPVWFVLEGSTLYLLPVQGSDTQWYKNVLEKPQIHVAARDADGDFRALPITDPTAVRAVVEKFRDKYGPKDVKQYYSKLDVAVQVDL